MADPTTPAAAACASCGLLHPADPEGRSCAYQRLRTLLEPLLGPHEDGALRKLAAWDRQTAEVIGGLFEAVASLASRTATTLAERGVPVGGIQAWCPRCGFPLATMADAAALAAQVAVALGPNPPPEMAHARIPQAAAWLAMTLRCRAGECQPRGPGRDA